MKLAIVDDDADDAEFASSKLREAGHAVDVFNSVGEFRRRIRHQTFDLAVFDWNMPEMSGFELLIWLREIGAPELPVIMATARSDTEDVALALDAGADDYVTKPFEPSVLLARINAVARRTIAKQKNDGMLRIGDLVLNGDSGRVWLNNEEILLTTKEFELAFMLLSNPGRPLSRTYLLESIWGTNPDVITRTLDVHISKIRTKLHLRPEHGFTLSTIYGYGYRLELI